MKNEWKLVNDELFGWVVTHRLNIGRCGYATIHEYDGRCWRCSKKAPQHLLLQLRLLREDK